MGWRAGGDVEVTILNRRLLWRGGAIEYEADPKHAEAIIAEMGLTGESRGLEAPIEKDTIREKEEDETEGDEEELLVGEETKKFR